MSKTGVIQPLPGIGDMVWHQPALAALAESSADGKVTLLTKPSSMAGYLFAADPRIEAVYPLPARRGVTAIARNVWDMWRVLRSIKLDRVYILHQSRKFQLAASLAGVKDIIAYPRDLARSKNNGWIKSLSFLKQRNIPIPQDHSQLFVSPVSRQAMEERCGRYPRPWFVLPVGASEPARCWAPDRFSACADSIAIQYGGTVFLTGSPREASEIQALHSLCTQKNIVALTDMPFDQFMALIESSQFVLGNDSGPANVAAALRKKSFMLCGISQPALHSPYMIMINPANPQLGMNGISIVQVMTIIEQNE